MRILESVMLTTYLILNAHVHAENFCGEENGIKRCCIDYRMENGTCVVCPAGYHGTNCIYICPQGYYGVKCLHQCKCKQDFECSPVRGCQKSGCGSIPVKDNTEVSFTTSSYGSKATYKCVKGFNQSGIDSITCLNNGTWETPRVHCDPKEPAKNEPDKNELTVSGTKQRTHSSGILVYLVAGVTLFFIVAIIIVVNLFRISFRIFTERNKLDLKFQNSIEMQIYSETDDQQV